MREKDSKIAQLQREAFGVEVHNVDGDVTRVVEMGGEGGGEQALKRMR